MSILHAIVFHKPKYTSKEEVLHLAREMFNHEKTKNFVRETDSSFRVRVVPKTQFNKTSFYSKPITKDITLVLGTRA